MTASTQNEQSAAADQLPKVYEPHSVEDKWYKFWLEKLYFHAEPERGKPRYCITIPPPNVTGSLHMGHALCYTIHDVLARWHRMKGLNTLIVPGTDHAGIGTQIKVEAAIAEEGLTRFDLGREKFLERVWKWKEEFGGTILMQLKRLGCSFDWDRERFTMDPGYHDAVLESFVRLFEKGYIYRGTRVINWCPGCGTGVSDLEVKYVEEHSHLWFIRYPLADGSGHIEVATTRPETMLGDTAVAVNPEDMRYMAYVGKTAILPIMERQIPIVDDSFVDPEFGTGAVKVTPAHDPNDFEIGQRHDLPQVIVIGTDGIMTEEAGKYAGLDSLEARKRIVAELKEKGLLVRVEDYEHSVGVHNRCDTTIEPLLSEQWFVRMKELAEPAIKCVRDGRVRFVPDRYARIYLDWMENIKDWCISRQLWWGHRIPVWKCQDCGEYTASKSRVEACGKCGSSRVEQDPDVLDTWFSSALWPFAVLGWPEKTPELEYYYPTDVLITARDIIYLWVARMIFSGLEYLDEVPFRDVYIYAMVLNQEGKRMSKSLGTGVDPLELIERFGADALRYALIQQTGTGQDIRFSDSLVENTRNFGNKIWNISRFVMMNLDGAIPPPISDADLKLEDRWILSRLNRVVQTVNAGFAGYDMDDAAKGIYQFLWSEFADWYVEIAKPRLRTSERAHVQSVLWHVLESSMRLLHPIMPFITEEIWHALPHEGESIMISRYPEAEESRFDEDAEAKVEILMNVIRSIRNLRSELGLQSQRVDAYVVASGSAAKLVQECADAIKNLARAGNLTVGAEVPMGKGQCLAAHLPELDVLVPVAGLVDVESEVKKISQEIGTLDKELARIRGKLGNEQFLSKAPAEIVEKERRIETELAEKREKLEERLRLFGG